MSDKVITVSSRPHPFQAKPDFNVFKGKTALRQILDTVQPDQSYWPYARIYIDGRFTPIEALDYNLHIKGGSNVSITFVPQDGGGGGGKNPLRTVLTLALAAAVPQLGFSLAAGLTGVGPVTALTLGVSRAVVGLAGNLLISAIAPPGKPKQNVSTNKSVNDTPTLFINGARNQLNPYGIIPRVYGTHRVVPPLAARTYTEARGDDNYLVMHVAWGYGPLDITDIKIGETPIEEFDDVEIEHRYGYDTDDDITLYKGSVLQDDLNVQLLEADSWQTRTTSTAAEEISIDVTLPRGLVEFDDQNNRTNRTVQLEVQYAPTGTSDWSAGASTYETIAAQSSDTIVAPGTANYKSDQAGYASRFYKRNDVIAIDRATGVVKVFTGERKGGFQSDGSAGTHNYTGEPVQPPVPSTYYKIALVESFGTTAINSVTDIRSSALFGVEIEDSGDFVPSQNGDQVDLTAGGLKFNGISITAKKASAIRRSVSFPVPSAGQYDVRIRRLTTDNEDNDKIFDSTYWTALRTIRSEAAVNFDGIAQTALRIRATNQLNGTIDTLNGVCTSILPDWDGSSWTEAPTSNPASIYRDILQGAANANPIADGNINLTALQSWHEANNENEREYNGVMDSQNSIWDTLAEVAATGRAAPGMIDNTWTVVRDVEQTVPKQHFTPRNMSDFSFEKAFPDYPHALRISFINRNQGYEQDEMTVYDDGYSSSNATKFENMELPGVTNPDQVWKDGRYHIATARLRPEVYTFKTDFEHLVATRGDLIHIQHDAALIGLGSARIKSITTNAGNDEAITLDADVTMQSTELYAVRIRTADGGTLLKNVDTDAGTTDSLTFVDAFTTGDIAVGDLVMFGIRDLETLEVIIKDIEPEADLAARIRCVPASPAIHTADTGTIPAFESNVTVPPEIQRPAQPDIVNVQTGEEVLIKNADGSFTPAAVITCKPTDEVIKIEPLVYVKTIGETVYTPANVLSVRDNQIVVTDVIEGEYYDFQVIYKSERQIMSKASFVTGVEIIGASGLPSDIENFNINVTGNTAKLTWDNITDVDVSHYVIKYNKNTSGATWLNSLPLGDVVRAPNNTAVVPANEGTYLIKAVDLGGRESENATSIVSGFAALGSKNVVSTLTENPSFAGTYTNTYLPSTDIRLAGTDTVDDWDDVDAVDNWDIGAAGHATTGYYTFANSLDLGAVYSSRLTADISVTGVDVNDSIDTWPNVDARESWDNTVDPSTWGCELQVRTTNDDPTGSPTWSAWRPFIVGDYSARAFEFRVKLSSTAKGITPSVSALEVVIDMPDRYETGNDITATVAGKTVTFNNAFRAAPSVFINGQSMATGDYFEVTSTSATSFTVTFYNSSDVAIERTFDYLAAGYGIQST